MTKNETNADSSKTVLEGDSPEGNAPKVNAPRPELTPPENLSLSEQLNLETARIPWAELQRFFASGNAVHVQSGLDLIETALLIHEDKAEEIKGLMASGQLDVVTDQQALAWHDSNSEVWAVVIKPWVLVQQV